MDTVIQSHSFMWIWLLIHAVNSVSIRRSPSRGELIVFFVDFPLIIALTKCMLWLCLIKSLLLVVIWYLRNQILTWLWRVIIRSYSFEATCVPRVTYSFPAQYNNDIEDVIRHVLIDYKNWCFDIMETVIEWISRSTGNIFAVSWISARALGKGRILSAN